MTEDWFKYVYVYVRLILVRYIGFSIQIWQIDLGYLNTRQTVMGWIKLNLIRTELEVLQIKLDFLYFLHF